MPVVDGARLGNVQPVRRLVHQPELQRPVPVHSRRRFVAAGPQVDVLAVEHVVGEPYDPSERRLKALRAVQGDEPGRRPAQPLAVLVKHRVAAGDGVPAAGQEAPLGPDLVQRELVIPVQGGDEGLRGLQNGQVAVDVDADVPLPGDDPDAGVAAVESKNLLAGLRRRSVIGDEDLLRNQGLVQHGPQGALERPVIIERGNDAGDRQTGGTLQ